MLRDGAQVFVAEGMVAAVNDLRKDADVVDIGVSEQKYSRTCQRFL